MTYYLCATPGRHTQGGELCQAPGLELEDLDKYTYSGHAANHLKLVAVMEVCNAAGLCMFGYLSYPVQSIPDQLSAATGWKFDMDSIVETGLRIFTMRHAFNLREGLNPLTRNMPKRIVGDPPLSEGNVKDITVDLKTLSREYLEFIGWDVDSTIPGDETLRKLGMEFLIDDMKKVNVPGPTW